MAENHAFASLSPRLLARKGGAKPAMRRQDATKFVNGGSVAPTEDLGWNDWGHNHDHAAPDPADHETAAHDQNQKTQGGEVAKLIATAPKRASTANRGGARKVVIPAAPAARASDLQDREIPEVLRQIEQIAWRINRAMPAAEAPKPEGRRAAFTLRLDAERHFRLKMAGVVLNRSAQVLVTEALDKYLSEIPEVAQAQRPAGTRP